MTKIQKIGEDLIPLSRRQNIVLLIIIACVFQFALFFSPVLAAEAANSRTNASTKALAVAEDDLVVMDSLTKSNTPDQEAIKLAPLMTEAAINEEAAIALQAEEEAEAAKPTVKVLRVSTHTITAYNSEAGQTDDSPCITANSFNVCEHGVEDTIAANFLKFGTKVQIPELFGDRVFVVRDRMNKKHANRVDIWMKEKTAAKKFGVKVAKIQVIE
jgi:3D (Asp-Asp-Asp) domain-containing protein